MSTRTFITLLVAAATTACGQPGLQRQDQWIWAVEEGQSTAPAVIRVRLIRSYNDVGTVTCMESGTLIYAVMVERGVAMTMENWAWAEAYILSSRDHVFKLTRLEVWKYIDARQNPENDGEMAKACRLIEQGLSAFIGDMNPRAYEGPKFPLSTARGRK